MIQLRKMNSVVIAVRELQRSLDWYQQHFGFERMYDITNGVVIGAAGVELALSQVSNPRNARRANGAKDLCIRMFGFEVTNDDLDRIQEEFPNVRNLVKIENPRYRSCILEDPDGHSIKLFVDIPQPQTEEGSTAGPEVSDAGQTA